MRKFVPVCPVDAIPPGGAKAFAVGDYEVAVFNVGGTFYAIDNTCPHQGGPLAEGWIDGAIVTCPWHAWCFDVRDGRMTLSDLASVDAFDVQVVDSTVAISSEPRR
jgi:nitrite reductase (NADH) small subunit/3-phenylpropionate/trans-cinnamate dioxygenase ferredoxin subunit